MARKKVIPRRKKAKTAEPEPEPEPVDHRAQARQRRYVAHRSVLTELRRIERHMQPAIPRLPFQRLCRDICNEYRIATRWTPSALLCLQEAAEDWLVEFFEDAYFLAAHAHRVTILPKDFNTLRIIRYRHERLLQPILSGDRRMAEILTLPPLHPRRAASDHPVQHDRNTRAQHRQQANDDELQTEAGPSCPEASPVAEEVIPDVTMADEVSAEDLLQARWNAVDEQQAVNNIALAEYLQFENINIAFTVRDNREVVALRREDIQVLMNPMELMSDPVVKAVIL